MRKLKVLNVQRMSMHDGPGLRTTVFLKGCNLRCAWCHNPESHSVEADILWNQKKCIGCGACAEACTAFSGRIGFPDLKQCTRCGKCVERCPADAIELAGRDMLVDDLLAEVLKDRRLFEISGGGVTFSGGEPMLQLSGLLEALEKLKKLGVDVAVDTAGNVPWEKLAALACTVDLFLFDLKTMQQERHSRYTGADNQQILNNLMRLSKEARVVVRIPLIEGVNTDEGEDMAQFLTQNCRVEGVELLRYHAIGKEKYLRLNRRFVEFEPPSEDTMADFKCTFERYGICTAM